MYVVVEAWTPKAEFLDLPVTAREEIFEAVQEGISMLALAEIDCLGWGRLDDVVHGTSHQWLAVWTMPTAEHSETFLAAVSGSDWYEWFDQINLRGNLVAPEQAMNEHVKIGF
jgi:hypothetical protein